MYNITVRRLVDTLILDSIDFNVIKAILNTPGTLRNTLPLNFGSSPYKPSFQWKFFQVNWWFKPAGERSWRTVKMYSKQDLSHVTKYDKYDRYSIDNRLGQYEGRVGKLRKKFEKFCAKKSQNNKKNKQLFVRVFDTLYGLRKKS